MIVSLTKNEWHGCCSGGHSMGCHWLSPGVHSSSTGRAVLAEGSQELPDGAAWFWDAAGAASSLLAWCQTFPGAAAAAGLCWPELEPSWQQRGERGGNGRREWEQPNVQRTMGYNQTLLAHHALPMPAFIWKVWGSCCSFLHQDFARFKCH